MRRTAAYFPIVPNRAGEIEAVGHLSPFARTRTRIIFQIDRPAEPDPLVFERHISRAAQRISRVWGTTLPLLVDLPFYGPEHRLRNGMTAREWAFVCFRQLRARAVPVAGLPSERGPEQIEEIRKIAHRDERGAALRVPYLELSSPDILLKELMSAIDNLKLPSESLDLLLDLETILGRPTREKNVSYLSGVIREALAVARQVGGFRNIVLCGSSVPERVGKEYEIDAFRGPRIEMAVWRSILKEDVNPVAFSDSGITPLLGDDPRGKGIALARVRLSTPDEHVFHRAARSGYLSLCAKAVSSADFNSKVMAWGASQLRECTYGLTGVSSPSRWVARDANLHFEATVSEIERQLVIAGRVNEYSFADKEKVAWLQRALLEEETPQ